jgi:hypothetical protein
MPFRSVFPFLNGASLDHFDQHVHLSVINYPSRFPMWAPCNPL